MRTLILLSFGLTIGPLLAQTKPPIVISLYTESIGLAQFKNIFRHSSLGIRVGTELTYARNKSQQYFQNINLSFHAHKEWHNAIRLTTAFGYRKYVGHWFGDVTAGGGIMLSHNYLPRYESTGNEYKKVSPLTSRFTPEVGVGVGYAKDRFAAFVRYEAFGEMPFGLNGLPVLPHQSFNVGTRLNLK
jgi:hypothetical protein